MYVRIKLSDIPFEAVDKYNLLTYEHGGWIYFEITKGVYGLNKLASSPMTSLTSALGNTGTISVPPHLAFGNTVGAPLFLCSSLTVLEFNMWGSDMLTTSYKHYGQLTPYTDWDLTKFTGIDLKWNYTKCICHLSMTNYIEKLLLKYNHPHPPKPQHSPHAHCEITYRAK
jgi:hypothetical protein